MKSKQKRPGKLVVTEEIYKKTEILLFIHFGPRLQTGGKEPTCNDCRDYINKTCDHSHTMPPAICMAEKAKTTEIGFNT